MKKLLYPFMLFTGALFFMTSCESDPVGPGDPNAQPPLLTLEGTEVTVEPTDPFVVEVNVIPGDADIRSLAVYEDAELVDPTRLTFNGDPATANPIAIIGDDKTGFQYDVIVESHADEAVRTYRFETIDENNNTDSKSVTVTTVIEVMIVPPTLTYMGAANITVDPGLLVGLEFSAVAGSGDITTVEVHENGGLVTDVTRLYYGDTQTQFDVNPYTIPAADQQGFDMRLIYIRVPNTGGTNSYDVIFSTSDGQSATGSVNITTGTAISNTLQGVLLNSAGPSGTGGLDLDDGIGTGSADPIAEIRDLGIDIGQPGSDWKKKIEGVNDFEVRLITPGANGVPETFTFADVAMTEAIIGAFNSSPLNTWQTAVGDIYGVSDGTKYYLIRTVEINETTTSGDNSDNYVFDVKY